MLQYLIILLDDKSVSYCHYQIPVSSPKSKTALIPLDTLQAGILFGMKENLNIQFVYSDHRLPEEYKAVIERIDHTKIKPLRQAEEADVIVLTNWEGNVTESVDGATCIIRTSRKELQDNLDKAEELLGRVTRLNVVLTDVEDFTDADIQSYQTQLEQLSDILIKQFQSGRMVQLNLLTDRLLLTQMNNCGAGDSSITLAPNGRFYLCPAFYYENPQESVGNLATGIDIKNRQLLRFDHAPICRHCDAWQCKRCVWMNSHLTMDINTPSHQQCVMSHIERNASRNMLKKMTELGIKMSGTHDIKEINYLDPFNNYKQWK